MLHFHSLDDASLVFKALSAPVRLQILKLLYDDSDKSMNDIANALNLTNSAITMHINKLEEAGLVDTHVTSGKRGMVKICKPRYEKLMIDMVPVKEDRKFFKDDIRVGYFVNFDIAPTCGIATREKMVGTFDDPRYFTFPERFDSSILWFGHGFIEYNIPNHLRPGQTLTELQLSFEISSECPQFNDDYPSDIYFSINKIPLGLWVSPGDFGERRGHFTPEWWPEVCNQYGLLKILSINKEGTFIDGGNKISDVTIDDLNINYETPITFRFEVPKDTTNCGGFTIFGEGFGDYNQAISVKAFYE